MTRQQIGIALAVLVAVGLSTAAFMLLRSSPEVTTDTWSASGGFMPWRDSTPLDAPAPPLRTDSPVESLGIVPLPVSPTGDANGGFDDLAALLKDLVQPTGPARADTDPATPSSYAFIPQGLLSLPSTKPQSPEQSALREYGNSLGLSLQSFADLHPNMTQILKDQAEDRANNSKSSALKRLGADFIQLGDDLAAMDSVPVSASSAHNALAAAYREAGMKLAVIPDASADDAFLNAINSYNSAASNLSQRIVGMIDLFVSRGVIFSQTDPGSVFTFDAEASY